VSELRLHDIELTAEERRSGVRITVLPDRRERLVDAEPNTFSIARDGRTLEVR